MKIRLAFTLVLCAIMICCVGCGQSTSEFPSLLSVTTVPSTTEFDQNTSTTPDVPPKTTSIESHNDVANVGGATSCIHTLIYGDTELDNSYHSIDSVLIEYVGEDSFVAWITEKEANKSSLDVCPFNHINIVKFVEDFEIPRQVFEDLYYNFLYLQYDYDIDAIYNGTVAAENYYTSDRLQTVLEKKTIRLFKSKLVDYVNTQNSTAFSSWIEEKNTEITRAELNETTPNFTGNYNQFSYIEFIKKFGITKTTAVELYNKAHAAYSGCERVVNFDSVYSDFNTLNTTSYSTTDSSARNTAVFTKDASYLWNPNE